VSNLFGKLKDFVGWEAQTDEDYTYDDEEMETDTGFQEFYSDNHVIAREPERTQSKIQQPETFGQTTSSRGSDMVNANINANANNNNNVVGMAGSRWGFNAEVIVMEPRQFEEMPQVIQALKDRKSVVLNLTMMNPEQAQRAVDFVAGATFTIDGHQERIGESIFLFTPSCVQVSTQAGGNRDGQIPTPINSKPAPTPTFGSDPVFSRIAQ
jgi:cell division inhibitor SepF